MAETGQPNYPDILGYVTGGQRHNLSVVQMALGLRPRVVRAGRAFEAILLLQNASDGDVDVTVTLQLPAEDAKKKPRRFLTKADRLVVGLRPAEAGYVQLPVSCLADTAISDGYSLGMSVEAKPLGKPRRVRLAEGGGEVAVEYLSDETLARLEDLKKLTFSVKRRGLMGTVLEIPFSVMSAQVGQMVDLKPAWVSLWRMSDYHDDRLLLDKYGELLKTRVLPALKRERLYKPLYDATQRRFSRSHYPVQPVEIHFITKALLVVLEMANPADEVFDVNLDDHLIVAQLFKPEQRASGEPITLPSWCRGMLKAIDRDPSTADHAITALVTTLYDELLRDAIRLAFGVLARATGEDMGNARDIAEYGERLVADVLHARRDFSFNDLYLPLVLGGLVLYDRSVLPDERIGELLADLEQVLKKRRPEINTTNQMAYRMAAQLVDRTLQKYGYRA